MSSGSKKQPFFIFINVHVVFHRKKAFGEYSIIIAKEGEPFKTKLSSVKPEEAKHTTHMFKRRFHLIPFVTFLQLFK